MPLILTGTSSTTTLDSSAGLTFSDSSNQSAAASPFGLKNRIINGDMVIDQRNAGASITATTATFGVDRWQTYANVNSKYTTQQNAGSVTPPVGFTNYLGVTSSSAYSSAAGDVFVLLHNIEGFNTADLGFGTANAKTVTLSFWVRSSLTGTFGGSLANNGYTRGYPFSYTISSANTWEQKSITIAGDTTGTWTTDNSAGIRLYIDLGSGSTYQGTAGSWGGLKTTVTGATSVVGTSGATFYITGVQLERNTTATPFEWIPYGTELALCQRYYAKTYDIGTVPGTASAQSGALCTVTNGVNTLFTFQHPVNMRAIPTVSFYSPNAGTINNIQSGSTSVAAASNGPLNGTKNSMCYSNACITVDVYAHMVASAEL